MNEDRALDSTRSRSLEGSVRRRFRFDASKRIKSTRDFDLTYKRRARSYNEIMTVLCRRRESGGCARLGLSVSRKVGCAVTRARWKRLIREAFRLNYDAFESGCDYVVVPKRCERVPDFQRITSDLRTLAQRATRKAARLDEQDAERAASAASSAEERR